VGADGFLSQVLASVARIGPSSDAVLPEVSGAKTFTSVPSDALVGEIELLRRRADRVLESPVTGPRGQLITVAEAETRARVLAAMEFVDAVILFGDETPYLLICQVVPDILVKGKDYEVTNIVGADFVMTHGGSVETIELVSGYSTSSIVHKIKTQ